VNLSVTVGAQQNEVVRVVDLSDKDVTGERCEWFDMVNVGGCPIIAAQPALLWSVPCGGSCMLSHTIACCCLPLFPL